MTDGHPSPEAGWSNQYRRPYVMTGGRTRSDRSDLPLEALVSVTPLGSALPPAERQRRAVVDLAAGTVSLAEISARLSVPLGVARVLVGDLEGEGYLQVHVPAAAEQDAHVDLDLLVRVRDGLRAL